MEPTVQRYDFSQNWFLPSVKIAIGSNNLEPNINFEKDWKQVFQTYSSSEKKALLLYALKQLKEDPQLPLFQLKTYLRTLENIALFPQVSNLQQRGFYSNTVRSSSNHILSMEGIALYLSKLYPDEKIYCIDKFAWINNCLSYIIPKTSNNETHVINISILKFSKLKDLISSKPLYFVYQYLDNSHKMLFVLYQKENQYTLSFFDSLGVSPTKKICANDFFQSELKEIADEFSIIFENLRVEALTIPRQKDNVNCGLFVISDLKIVRKLLSEGKQPINDKFYDLAFLNISQHQEHLSYSKAKYQRLRNDPSNQENEVVNMKASSLAIKILESYFRNDLAFPEDKNSKSKSNEYEAYEDEIECCILI